MKFVLWLILFCSATAFAQRQENRSGERWFKGNLHTHTFWSDGDDFPDMVVNFYHTNGYHFLGISDHNIFLEGEKWVSMTNTAVRRALPRYQATLGRDAETRQSRNGQQIRLRTLAELKEMFEQSGKFIMLPSQEITDRHLVYPVHINVSNPKKFLKPQGGTNVVDVMQRNVSAVLKQREETGQPMFPHLNHPNFGWGVTAEDLMQVKGERFFEVYNGHHQVHNDGDDLHASTDRMWDIILTRRISELDGEPLYGLGVDDGHHYHTFGTNYSNPGRGWVVVRAARLTPENIIHAMETGDFYASSGVQIKNLVRNTSRISFEVISQPGVTYKTEFIGTRRGFDPTNTPIQDRAGNKLRVTHRYSKDIGEVLAQSSSLRPTYKLKGDELYVRARVTSTKVKPHGSTPGETEKAWIQPVFPKIK